jgi:hypothetical protein
LGINAAHLPAADRGARDHVEFARALSPGLE